MLQVLVFLHFVGLMLGAAGGMGAAVVMRRAAALPPEQAAVVKGLGPVLATVSGVGLAVLWLTGLALVWGRWAGLAAMPALFWVKMAAVVALTLVLGMQHATYARVRRGDGAAAARLPVLGAAGGAASLLAVLFAVLAFRG